MHFGDGFGNFNTYGVGVKFDFFFHLELKKNQKSKF